VEANSLKTIRDNYPIIGFIFLLLFVLTFSAIRIYSGSVLTSGAWDLPIFLDGAWRVSQGKVVHADFSSPLGPVTFFIGALGIKLKGLHLQSFSYGITIIFISYSILFYLISLRVMHPLLSLLSSIFVGSFIITPRILGYFPSVIGYAGQYNNICYALFFIVGILLFLEGKKKSKLLDFFDGVAIGGITVIMLFTKITFAMASSVLIGYRLLIMYRINTKEWMIGIGLGLGIFFALFFLYFGFNINPFIRDMRIVVFSRSQSMDLFILLKVFYRCLPSVLAVGTASYLLFYKIVNMDKKEYYHHAFILLIIVCCGYFLAISIDQPPEFPLSALCAFYLFSISINSFQATKVFFLSLKRIEIMRIAFYGICIVLIGKPILWNFMGNGYALYLKTLPSKDHYNFNVPPLSDALLLKSQYKELSESYNDGFDLLQTETLKHEKILSVEYPNIFSFGLGRQSPVGDLLYWHNRMTFDTNVLTVFSYFNPENIFHDVDIVMVPKKHIKIEGTRAFLALYNDYLNEHFIILKESSRWILYRKI